MILINCIVWLIKFKDGKGIYILFCSWFDIDFGNRRVLNWDWIIFLGVGIVVLVVWWYVCWGVDVCFWLIFCVNFIVIRLILLVFLIGMGLDRGLFLCDWLSLEYYGGDFFILMLFLEVVVVFCGIGFIVSCVFCYCYWVVLFEREYVFVWVYFYC